MLPQVVLGVGVKAKVDTTWTEIDKMLECIPADTDRQTWLNVAMAIHEFDYINDEKLGYFKFYPSTMCNLLRASTKPLAATIMANAEPRGSAPMVVDSSLAYRRTTSGSRFKSTLGSLTLKLNPYSQYSKR
jgi:hypothetical protein